MPHCSGGRPEQYDHRSRVRASSAVMGVPHQDSSSSSTSTWSGKRRRSFVPAGPGHESLRNLELGERQRELLPP